MKTPKEFIEIALGGNMNISTLKLKVWEEMLEDYAKYYHQESNRVEPQVMQGSSSADEICGCGGKIKSYGIAGEKYCEYCNKSF